ARLEPAAVGSVVVAVIVAVPEYGDAVQQIAADPAILGSGRALGADGERGTSARCTQLATAGKLARFGAVLDPPAHHRLDATERRREVTGTDADGESIHPVVSGDAHAAHPVQHERGALPRAHDEQHVRRATLDLVGCERLIDDRRDPGLLARE